MYICAIVFVIHEALTVKTKSICCTHTRQSETDQDRDTVAVRGICAHTRHAVQSRSMLLDASSPHDNTAIFRGAVARYRSDCEQDVWFA
jgi:hypothetical protein